MRKTSKFKRICFLVIAMVLIFSMGGCSAKATEDTDVKKKTEQNDDKNDNTDSSKNENEKVDSAPDEKNNKEPEEEKTIAEGVYKEGAFFQFGLVAAKTEDKKWGFMNQNGEWAIEPKFRSVHDFGPAGWTFVSTEKKQWRLIDTSGNFVSDRVYTYVSDFSPCGIAEAEEIVDKKTKRFYIYQDENGKFVEYDASKWGTAGNFSADGYAVVSVWDDATTTSTYGLINSNFEYVIEPTEGLYFGVVRNGMISVVDEINEVSGMMNVQGEWVYQTENYLSRYNAKLYDNGRILDFYDYIRDASGNVITTVKELTMNLPMGPYAGDGGKAYEFDDWLMIGSGSKNSSFNINYLDENLQVVFPYPLHFYSNDSYGSGYGDMRYGRLVVKLPVEKNADGKVTAISDVSDQDKSEYEYLVLDKNKNIIFVPSEIGVSSVHDYFSDGYTYARNNGKYAVLDMSGNIIFTTSEAVEFKSVY